MSENNEINSILSEDSVIHETPKEQSSETEDKKDKDTTKKSKQKGPNILLKKLKKIDVNYIIVPVLGITSIVSYITFASYKPLETSDNNQTAQVKGMQDVFNANESSDSEDQSNTSGNERIILPVLFTAEVISDNFSDQTRTMTLQTSTEPQEVMNFYDAALVKRDWEIDSFGESGTFLTKRYKRGKDSIEVSISKQLAEQSKDITIVTVEAFREE